MSYQKNFGGTDGRGNELNRTNISGVSSHIEKYPCDMCRIPTVNKGIICGHVFCDACSKRAMCIFCNLADKIPSYVKETESMDASPRILSSGRNKTNDFDISYEEKGNRELVPHPIKISTDENKEPQQVIVPSSPSISPLPSNSPSQLSAKFNLSFEYGAGPSRTNDYEHGAINKNIPASSMHFAPQSENQNSKSQRTLEVEEIDVLKDVNIGECGHGESEWFCKECFHAFCCKCKENHKHKLSHISEEIEHLGNFSKLILQNESKIDDAINDALLKIKDKESKLEKQYKDCEKEIKYYMDALKTELSARETTLLNSLEEIEDFKISEESMPPGETSGIYVNLDDENICSDLIKEFGLVFGSASGEKTVVSGIALSTIIIDHPCGFIVQCYDLLKNKCFTGGEDIKATLTYPNKMRCNVPIIDLMNGFYQGVVNTNVEGNHILKISLRGYPICKKEYVLISKPYVSLETVIRNSRPHCLEKNSECWKDMHCDENGRLLITDSTTHKFHIYDHEDKRLKSIGNKGVGNGEFQKPYGITVDREKRIIVVDSGNHRVQVFSYDGEFIFTFGSIGSDKSHFKFPERVATNSKGYIAVSDKGNHRIQLFEKDGTLITIIKSIANSNIIESPHGLCFEEDDTILLSCWGFDSVPTTRLKRLKITSSSDKVDFQTEELPPLTNEVIKNHKLLFISKEYYIFTSLNMEGGFSSLYFYNTRNKDLNQVNFEEKTVSSVALSPEGYLYILFLNSNKMSELYKYKGN